jgi:hypothetical protein
VLYERWLVIEALKMDFGASPMLRLRAPLGVVRVATTLPAVPSALTAVGSSLPSLAYCAALFETAACSSSAMPS